MRLPQVLFYFGLIILSVLVTEAVSIFQAIVTNSLVGGGSSGLPFSFSSSGGLMGSGTFDYKNFAIDVCFWFVLIIILGKIFKNFVGKK